MITLSVEAKKYIENILKTAQKPALTISVEKGGCSGMQYKFTYSQREKESDHIINFDNFKIFIDKHALLFIIGTQLDYVETNTSAKLIFKNPNAQYNCGCGKSFGI